MTTQKPTVFRYRCACGHRGRWYRDPNGAVADSERHRGLDSDRHPCRERRTSDASVRLEVRRDGRVTALR